MRNGRSILIILGVATIFASSAVSQDLGSSNKLFGSGKSTTSNTTKKPAPKPKAETTKPKTTAKATAPKVTTPKSSTAKNKPAPAPKPKTADNSKKTAVTPKKEPAASSSTKAKYTEFKSGQPSKIEITVGKAQPNLVTAPTNNDDRYEDLIQSGNEARDDRNYSSAETSYKSARMLKPKDARATYGLGNLYSDQQRWEEAENAYRSALQLDPNNAIGMWL
ncbi:MAG: tetratricopeptide repeat protein [Pyrinomonadaceae bacterium]